MKNDFYKLVLEQVEEATRHKKAGVELPSQVEELETYVQNPAKYFITFTSDLSTKLKKTNEIKGRRKRKKHPERSGLPWWKKIPGSTKGQKSPTIPKLGINPASAYNTPNGIYSYPLNRKIFQQLRQGQLPFAQDKPYFSIFEIREGKNIITINDDGQVDGLGEQEYQNYLDKIISDDFFDKISQKRIQGQKDSQNSEDFWKNYKKALDASKNVDYSNIKDGFGGEFVKKYLKPRIESMASYHRVHTANLSKTGQVYLELSRLLDEEYEGTPDDVGTDRYQYLDNFEIFIEDLSALLFDWNLTTRKEEESDLRRSGLDLLGARIFKKSEDWKNLKGIDEWSEKIKKISEESDHWLEQKTYPQLTEFDIRAVRSVFQAYQDYIEEDGSDLLPERLMPLLISTVIAEVLTVNSELDGTGTQPKKGKIEDFLDLEAHDRIHPKDTDFIKNIENLALIDTPFGKLWAITRILADTEADPMSTNKWARIWRNLGIDGIIDLGRGLIHSSEPSQALFFSRSTVREVKSFDNKSTPDKLRLYGVHKRLQGQLRGNLFAIARKNYGSSSLPKEYFQFLHGLVKSTAMRGNMGLENLHAMIIRNMNHFPATNEDLKARLEDKNYKRGKPEQDDRLIDGFSLGKLAVNDIERVYNLGFLPLLSPEYINMFSIRAKSYNHWIRLGREKRELTGEFNKANAQFFGALKKAKEEGNNKAVEIARGMSSEVLNRLQLDGPTWSTIKGYIKAAQTEGIKTFNLLNIVGNLSKLDMTLESAKALYEEIGESTRDISEIEQTDGAVVAHMSLKERYKTLSSLVDSLLGGNLNDSASLLKIQKRAFPWNPDGSSKVTKEPTTPPWFSEARDEEVGIYLESKSSVKTKKIIMAAEDMVNPDIPAPWEIKK